MKTKSFVKGICCVLAVICMASSMPLELVRSEAAPTSSKIDEIKNDIKDLEKKKKEYEDKIKDIEKESSSALEKRRTYEGQIDTLEGKIDSIDELIREYDQLINQNQQSIEQKNADYEAMFEKVLERLRIRYETGISNPLAYVLEAESFIDFLVNYERTVDIIKYDRRLMDNIQQQKADLDTDRELLQKYKDEQKAAKESLEAEKKELDKQKANLNDYIDNLEKDEEKYKEMLEEVKAMDDALNKKLEEELQKLVKDEVPQQPMSKSDLMWPVSVKYSQISSAYGWRELYGVKSFHYGIDIPAPAGSNVYAAQSGKVVYSQWHSSYGNFVVINHGGGYTTLYAHNTSNAVTEGQTVSRGDVIAYVGTTGSSTGNHCHFEVRLNGKHQQPLNYVNQP